jgi:ABC-2 type transport system ATP-binding protein
VTATVIDQPKIVPSERIVGARTVDAVVPALLVERVTKRFVVGRKRKPVTAIADVSLRLERGDIVGVLGANGSGKSTLIRLVSGLLTLDEGRVSVFGHDIERDEMAVKRLINRVSVDAAFFKKLSPMENLLFAARLYGLDAGKARRDAVAILARLGIAEKRVGRPIEQMSRGMQQKVAIARALLTSPSLLLLDEPTTGLDPRSRRTMWEIVRGLVAGGATIFLTTQYLDEADELADRIGVLDGGRLVAEGTAEELKRLVPGATLRLTFRNRAELESAATALSGAVTSPETLTLSVPSDGSLRSLRSVLRTLDDAALDPEHLAVDTPDLDDVFLALTGRPTDETVEIS